MEEPDQGTQMQDLAARAEAAQKAFQERPHISIRTRLTIGSLAWFLFMLALAIGSIVNLSNMASKLVFTEAVDHYTFEVQQARRFEKNYFLYRTNLPDALSHVDSAQFVLEEERGDIESVIGVLGLQDMTANLLQYESLLDHLLTLDQASLEEAGEEIASIEAGLRELGAVIVEEAEDLVERERQAVTSMLGISQRIPLAILLLLIGLIVYTAYLIRKQMLAPLSRMMKATERIANGDFTPITPVRKYHDEFSHLA
ncbi:HAMP domain-containing protein, partial [Gemmatimonadota bacterium]